MPEFLANSGRISGQSGMVYETFFSVYTENKRQGVRGAIKLINSSSNRGHFFQYAGRFFPGYTEKNARGVAAGINSGSIRGRFFSVCGGVFFSMRQSGNVFCRYTGDPRTEKKRQRGSGGD